VGFFEFTGFISRLANAEQELAFRREGLHAVVHAAHPDPVVPVRHDADRAKRVLQVSELILAESTRHFVFIAPRTHEDPRI